VKILGYILIAVSVLLIGNMLLPRLAGSGPAPVAATKTQIGAFRTALDAIKQDVGAYPSGSNGLVILLRRPEGAPGWRGPYLEEKGGIPNDPWGRPYVYECLGKHNTNSFDLSSAGPDGRFETGDDITNWLSVK